MADYAIFDVTVTLVTPLHIGNGRELLREYDFAVHNGRTWRINETALLDAQDADDPETAAKLASIKPAELLRPADFRPDSPFFRYVLRGVPRSKIEGAQVREQLKDPFDRPYLPGSSLKGALRTALAWHAWQAHNLKPDVAQLGQRREWAAQAYEQRLFGRDPNHDLLRALHVSDNNPVEQTRLILVNARVITSGGKLGSPIELEALQPDTAFALTLKVDRALFTQWAQRAGLPQQAQNWLQQLPQIVQSHSADLIRREIAWFGKINGAGAVLGLYQRLGQAKLGSRQCLLAVGWGTGWTSKTFGSRLQADQAFMERIIQDYKLARGRRQPNDPFPKSRRVVMGFRDGQEYPASPLGWVLMELKARP